ncbi:hypothetical protein KJ870_07105 [bacterium]|nr:hypothetical protein [bacterium]MBU1434687.1 hypothetical protein [bacterium]MBU1502675.1 hypothetical protein [bacterium]
MINTTEQLNQTYIELRQIIVRMFLNQDDNSHIFYVKDKIKTADELSNVLYYEDNYIMTLKRAEILKSMGSIELLNNIEFMIKLDTYINEIIDVISLKV